MGETTQYKISLSSLGDNSLISHGSIDFNFDSTFTEPGSVLIKKYLKNGTTQTKEYPSVSFNYDSNRSYEANIKNNLSSGMQSRMSDVLLHPEYINVGYLGNLSQDNTASQGDPSIIDGVQPGGIDPITPVNPH